MPDLARLSVATSPDRSSRYFDPTMETLERGDLERLQDTRLLEMVPYAYEHSDLVRATWTAAGVTPRDIKSADDYRERAPFIDKDSIRLWRARNRDPFGGLLCVPVADLWVLGSTTGTSGDPTPLPQGRISPMVVGLARDFWEAGARQNDVVAYTMFTWRAGHGLERFEHIPVSPIFINQGIQDIPALLEASERFEPRVLYTINNFVVGAINAHATASGLDPREVFTSYSAMIFGGEPMSGATIALLKEWDIQTHDMTTLGDVCGAIECGERSGFHAWEDLAFVEHLEVSGTSEVGQGSRGELVVTSLTDFVAPMMRYRSDDIIELTREVCACGRTHARFRVLGRKGDEVLVEGRSILPRDIWPAIESVPAAANGLFQLIRPQRECAALKVRVGYDGDSPSSGMGADLISAIEAAVGLRPEIDLVPSSQLLRLGSPHKIPRVSAS